MTPDPWPRILAALTKAARAYPATPRGERASVPSDYALMVAASSLPQLLMRITYNNLTTADREECVSEAIKFLAAIWHRYDRHDGTTWVSHPAQAKDYIVSAAASLWFMAKDPDEARWTRGSLIAMTAVAIGAAIRHSDGHTLHTPVDALCALAAALPAPAVTP